MKLDSATLVHKAGQLFRKLRKQPERLDTKEARLAAARAIDLSLAKVFNGSKGDFAQGLLRGLQVPMNRAHLNDAPYVFVSHVKPFNLADGFTRRPDHFRAVDDTQFLPCNTRAENAEESLRVGRRLQQFIHTVRREPELLLEPMPAFTYKVRVPGADRQQTREAPAMDVLAYALRERNTVIAGIIAAELANLARSPVAGERALQMLRANVALAVDIDDGPYASMLLMGLAAAQPRAWLEQRIAAAAASDHPVAGTLTHFQQFAGRALGLESKAWEAHWLHHDASIRDFVHTCTIDVLLYAADTKLGRVFGTDPVHRNHFMHGNMVLTELETRLETAERAATARAHAPGGAEREAVLGATRRLVDVLRLEHAKYAMKDKIALLNARMDDMELTFV